MRVLWFVVLNTAIALGQTAKPPAAPTSGPNPVGISTGLPFVGLSADNEVKMLRLERKSALLQARINKARVEQREAEQEKADVDHELQLAATQVATDMKVDSTAYDFDADNNRFVKKKVK